MAMEQVFAALRGHFPYSCCHLIYADFVISKVTPQMLSELHYKIFFVYGTLNIGALAVFAL